MAYTRGKELVKLVVFNEAQFSLLDELIDYMAYYDYGPNLLFTAGRNYAGNRGSSKPYYAEFGENIGFGDTLSEAIADAAYRALKDLE